MPSLKSAIILFIRCYQKYAPRRIRQLCVYTPCCSDYMVGSIEKHGLLIGLGKGTLRICRCRPGRSGTDYP